MRVIEMYLSLIVFTSNNKPKDKGRKKNSPVDENRRIIIAEVSSCQGYCSSLAGRVEWPIPAEQRLKGLGWLAAWRLSLFYRLFQQLG